MAIDSFTPGMAAMAAPAVSPNGGATLEKGDSPRGSVAHTHKLPDGIRKHVWQELINRSFRTKILL